MSIVKRELSGRYKPSSTALLRPFYKVSVL